MSDKAKNESDGQELTAGELEEVAGGSSLGANQEEASVTKAPGTKPVYGGKVVESIGVKYTT